MQHDNENTKPSRRAGRPDLRLGLAVLTTIGIWARVLIDLLRH